ncbi:hypothetical protein N7534_010215 [Penicillium rubens]|nr:hypothetical protein N7534_010215 [Penicillium rubens]
MCLPHIGPRTQGALPGPNRILEGYCDPLAEGVTGLFQAGKRLWARQKQTTEAVIVTGNRVVKVSGTSVDLEMGIDKLDSRRVAVLMVDKNCLVDLEPGVHVWGDIVTRAETSMRWPHRQWNSYHFSIPSTQCGKVVLIRSSEYDAI